MTEVVLDRCKPCAFLYIYRRPICAYRQVPETRRMTVYIFRLLDEDFLKYILQRADWSNTKSIDVGWLHPAAHREINASQEQNVLELFFSLPMRSPITLRV